MAFFSLFCYFKYIRCVSMTEKITDCLKHCNKIMVCQKFSSAYILHSVPMFIMSAIVNVIIHGIIYGLIDKTFHWLILMSIVWLCK